jgi:Holliday junction resolvase RusA-like endonuclease
MNIKLYYEGKVIPKARPRVTFNGTFNPENYVINQDELVFDLKCQKHQMNLATIINPIEITINFIGKHSRKGDIDNLPGSILDAMVKAEIIKNDNLMIVKKLTSELIYDQKQEPLTEIILSA